MQGCLGMRVWYWHPSPERDRSQSSDHMMYIWLLQTRFFVVITLVYFRVLSIENEVMLVGAHQIYFCGNCQTGVGSEFTALSWAIFVYFCGDCRTGVRSEFATLAWAIFVYFCRDCQMGVLLRWSELYLTIFAGFVSLIVTVLPHMFFHHVLFAP